MMKAERIARIAVIFLILGVVSSAITARAVGSRGVNEVHGKMAEDGGWTPEVIRARVGEPFRLRLTSEDVVHGFAIGQSDQPGVDVEPGKYTDLTLTFDEPGKYTFYCTRWCGMNHWRMRGTIEVAGDTSSSTGKAEPKPDPEPLYLKLELDIDAPHPAEALPERKPRAKSLATIPQKSQLPDTLSPDHLSSDFYRSHAPSRAFLELRADASLAALTDAEIWDLVAAIWRTNTTSEGLGRGEQLYAQNCAACHGEKGSGDGVFADDVQAKFGGSMADMETSGDMAHSSGAPADFTDPASMLGASPALLQGKILRGGMGSGMPYWGPIFTDAQTWDLVAYIYSLNFEYSEVEP